MKYYAARSVQDTSVYKLALMLSMEIVTISKKFPKEETDSLTDQIRRSSRSVCICLLEAYRKKRNPAHFVSKVTDSDRGNSETCGWLDYSFACGYIQAEEHPNFISKNEEIGRLLNHMIHNPEKY